MKSKAEKEFEQEKMIAQAIVDLRSSVEDTEKLAQDYFEAAVEAVNLGQDEYANELLETIVELEDFAENLKFVEVKIKTTAMTSNTFKKLGRLPNVISACKNILGETPNFTKLGKDMSKLMSNLSTARDELRKFRGNLSQSSDPVYAEIFGTKKTEDPKFRQRLADKKKALESRLVRNAQTPAPAAATTTAAAGSAADVADVDRIAAMLDEERKNH